MAINWNKYPSFTSLNTSDKIIVSAPDGNTKKVPASAITSSVDTLQEITDNGNTTTNQITISDNHFQLSDAYSIKWGSTFNNRIYNQNSDFVFIGNASEKMRLTSGGNVLIGTTTDLGEKLQVLGNIKLCTSNASYYLSIENNLSYLNPFNLIGAFGVELLTLNSGQISTATNAGAKFGVGTKSPSEKLHVVGDALITGDSHADAFKPAVSGNPIKFKNFGSTELARITDGGNLLLGTTSDSGYKLQVESSSGNNYVSIKSYWANNVGILFSDGLNRGLLSMNPNNDMLFLTGGLNERARITSGGNLLIGTTTDDGSNKLQVYGGVKALGHSGGYYLHSVRGNSVAGANEPFLALLNNSTISSATYGWAWYDSNVDGSLQLWRRNNSTTGNQVLTFNRSNGNVTLTGSLTGTTATFSGNVTVDNIVDSFGEILTFDQNDLIAKGKHVHAEYGLWARSPIARSMGIDGTATILGLYTNASEKARITSGGNLLIGTTTNNGYKTEIAGNLALSLGADRYLRIGSSTNYWWDFKSVSNDLQLLEAGTTARLIVKAGGNVLIGTTTDSGEKLQVEGNAKISGLSNYSSDYNLVDINSTKTNGSAVTNVKGINLNVGSNDHIASYEITNLYGAYINNNTSGGSASVINNWYGIYIPPADSDRVANRVSAYFGDNVGIGTSSPNDYYSDDLVISSADEKGMTIAATTTSATNYIMFADGTSGNEAYRGYVGYNHSSDYLRFGTSGSEKMRLTTTGLGIGTTSIANKLDVNGNISATTIRIGSNASGEGIIRHNTGGGNGIGITTGALSSSSIGLFVSHSSNNRNVGIGTTSPNRQLQVKKTTGTASIAITSSNTGIAQLELGGTSDNDIAGVTYNGNTSMLSLKTNNTGQLYVTNGGNVLISTTTDSGAKLDVSGVDNGVFFRRNTGQYFKFTTDAHSNRFESAGKTVFLGTTDAETLRLKTNDTARLSITSGGNVLIGTTSDSGKKLQINSDTTYDGIQITGANIPTLGIIDTTNNAKLVVYTRDNDATIGTETNHVFTFQTNAVERARFSTNGNLLIGTTTDSGEKLVLNGNQRINTGEFFITESGSSRKPVRLHKVNYKGAITLQRDADNNVNISSDFTNLGHTYFDGNGVNVGVAIRNPTANLHVNGTTTLGTYLGRIDIVTTGATVTEGPAMVLDGRNLTLGSYDNGRFYVGIKQTHTNNTTNDDTIQFICGDSEKMRLTSGGNLLLGTTTDSGDKLQVNGTTRISGVTIIGNQVIFGFGSNGGNVTFNSTNLILTANSGKGISLNPNNQSSGSLIITSTGNANFSGSVSIGGTAGAVYKLDVVGKQRVQSVLELDDVLTLNAISTPADPASGKSSIYMDSADGAIKVKINVGGTVVTRTLASFEG